MNKIGYAKFEISRPLYSIIKKVSAPSLKVGDRFIYRKHTTLVFKTNAKPVDGKYLCCDDEGKIEWIDGEMKVTKINGIAMDLFSFSRQFKNAFLKNKSNTNKTLS